MSMLRSLGAFRGGLRALEDRWFDWTRRVDTSGYAAASGDPGAPQTADSYGYLPVRSANAREALRKLPIRDISQYTFIDVGSGKGRVLFLAAEFPFRRVIGVEFDRDLYETAVQNVARSRAGRRRCASIEPLLADAATYAFPPGPMVVYLFNPFGPRIMARMLDSLESTFQQQPRHILLLMLWPQHADVAAQRQWLRETQRTRRYRLFEAGRESTPSA